jgi:hypothetical protein
MPASSSSVSVVVPTYNRASMLAECLASLAKQTQPPLEVLVIDDGSSDDTPIVARRFEPMVRYFRKENGGKPAALNFALPLVRGDWVWFLDDDDVALPRSIESRLATADAAPDAALVISRFLWGSSDSSGLVQAGEPLRWPAFDAVDFYPKFLRSCFAHLNGALIRRTRVAEVGWFRTDLLTSEDYDYTLRVARGVQVALCDEPTFVFRQHGGMRGPQGRQYSAAERLRKFADGDAAIGRAIRESHRLPEYLGLPADRALDGELLREALLARLQVMAGKGLLAEVGDDAVALSTALEDSGKPLDVATADAIKGAMQERYLTVRMSESPAEALRVFAPLRRTGVGRAMLRTMTRALLGLVWWQQAEMLDKLRLAGIAVRLQWFAPGAAR